MKGEKNEIVLLALLTLLGSAQIQSFLQPFLFSIYLSSIFVHVPFLINLVLVVVVFALDKLGMYRYSMFMIIDKFIHCANVPKRNHCFCSH